MKTIRLFTGVLLALAGFCAGVGFNFLPISATVWGAPEGPPEPPPAALKSVAHDATLTGDGTTTRPLGIANGGVTAPKLSTARIPTTGQVLGFNGTNLAWQNAPVGGVRVVDSRGQIVGPLFYTTSALREISGLTFAISVTNNGFRNNGVWFYHTTSDCSGPRYLPETGTYLYRLSQNTSTQLFYAAAPLRQITINSLETIDPPADPNQPGRCDRYNPFTELAGSVTTVDLSTLGLIPPFRLQF